MFERHSPRGGAQTRSARHPHRSHIAATSTPADSVEPAAGSQAALASGLQRARNREATKAKHGPHKASMRLCLSAPRPLGARAIA